MDQLPTFRSFAAKTIVVHSVTYFVMGLFSMWLFDYARQFETAGLAGYMRPVSDPLVRLGPALQPIRGLLFAIALYPFREQILRPARGWLHLWGLLALIGIFSTFGPSPGSVEGLIYTTVPPLTQIGGLFEVVLQSLLLSIILPAWVNHPERRWVGRILVVAFVLAVGLPLLGMLVLGFAPTPLAP